MPTDWRRLLEQTNEPWYLLADDHGLDARIVARTASGSVETGNAAVNIVVRYDADDGSWLEVGTWDSTFSGPVPDEATRAQACREGVLDRLAFAVAGRPFAAGSDDPNAHHDPVLGHRDDEEAWRPIELTIDGTPQEGLLRRAERHEIAYTTVLGRCVFVHACDRSASAHIVSCRDLAALDAFG